MAINITMPALSPTMEEGNLAKWHVKEGDSVSSGDVIAEIETDKATMEVEAVDEGTMAKILVEEGAEGVAVNTVIAILAEDGEDISAAAKSDGNAEAKASPEKSDGKESAQGEASKPEQKTEEAPQENQKPAESKTESLKTAAQPKANGDERIFSSPLARRMARESGIDLSALSGSGPRGRIVKSDVEAAMKGQPESASSAQPASDQAKAPATDDAVLKLFEEGSYELKPHDGMRKTIAKRLVESKQKIPHFYLTVDCELDALLALRRELNAAAPVKDDKPAYKISVNDLVIKAMAMSLMAVPEANASWTEKNMVYHKHADVGVAVSIPGGLITPVVRKADRKGLSEIANEMKDLAGRARERKLKPEEYQGGTTAVSNLGMFGIKEFSAVINPPHATILAVGAGEERVVVKDGAPAVATVMSATLSTDHRAVDGALGAELLQAFKKFIEKPLGMLV